MIYIDDSGHPHTGLVVYGWIEFPPFKWPDVLRSWLLIRKALWREYGIPITKELHATDYVNGRGRISKQIPSRYVERGQELWKDLGRDVALRCLDALRCAQGARVGAVWRWGDPKDLGRTRSEAYESLVCRFEKELKENDELGIIFMDGDGSDPTYRQSHRKLKLSERRVLEDAIHIDSKRSQLVQMADLIAWSAAAHIDRYPKNEFAWNWYSQYLSERDPAREPLEI